MGVETDDVDKGFERWLCARFSEIELILRP